MGLAFAQELEKLKQEWDGKSGKKTPSSDDPSGMEPLADGSAISSLLKSGNGDESQGIAGMPGDSPVQRSHPLNLSDRPGGEHGTGQQQHSMSRQPVGEVIEGRSADGIGHRHRPGRGSLQLAAGHRRRRPGFVVGLETASHVI